MFAARDMGAQGRCPAIQLFIGHWAQHRDGEVCQVSGTLVELQPSDGAMILEVTRDARLGDAQVLGQTLLQQAGILGAAAAAKQVSDANTQSLAGLDVIVGNLIGVRKKQHTRPSWGLVRIVQRGQRARQKAAKLRFELGDA